MQKPLYNKNERWQIRNIDCLDTDLKKLKLAVLHFRKQIQKDFEIVFKL